jgi:hypothetical protein
MKPSTGLSWVVVFCLLLLACTGAPVVSSARSSAGHAPTNKISPDIREQARRGAAGETSVSIILQLNARPGARLNALLNRNGVHVRAEFTHLNALARELPLGAVGELASYAVATYSARGPTRSSTTDPNGVRRYDHLIKPDLVAPGNRLMIKR